MQNKYALQQDFYMRFSILNKNFPLPELDENESGCLVYGNNEMHFVVKNYQNFQQRFEIRLDFVSSSKAKNRQRYKILKKAYPHMFRINKNPFSKVYHVVVFRGNLGITARLAVDKLVEKYNMLWSLFYKDIEPKNIENKYQTGLELKKHNDNSFKFLLSLCGFSLVTLILGTIFSFIPLSIQNIGVIGSGLSLLTFLILLVGRQQKAIINHKLAFLESQVNGCADIKLISDEFRDSLGLKLFRPSLSRIADILLLGSLVYFAQYGGLVSVAPLLSQHILFIGILCFFYIGLIYPLSINFIWKVCVSFFKMLLSRKTFVFLLSFFILSRKKRRKYKEKLIWLLYSEDSLITVVMRLLLENITWHTFFTKNKFCFKIYKFFSKRGWATDAVFEKHLMIMDDVWSIKKQQAVILKEQDSYDLTDIAEAKKIIVFLIPNWCPMWGGIMTMFAICTKSREIEKDAVVLLSTLPGFNFTFSQSKHFPSNEKVYRFEQIRDHAKNCKKLILHLVTYSPEFFYQYLSKKDKKFLAGIKNLQINIMNQSITVCPRFEKIKDLKKLTSNITMTTAHESYATQDVCNQFHMPLKHISTCLDLKPYAKIPYAEKEKLILYSPDPLPEKEDIIRKLKQKCPEYEFRKVLNMTFAECMRLTSKSILSISFGEGFDGYLLTPLNIGSLGAAVYNTKFFPEWWKDAPLVYSSFDEMVQKLPEEIKKWENDPSEYYKVLEQLRDLKRLSYSDSKIEENLRNFYNGKYDFYPEEDYWRSK